MPQEPKKRHSTQRQGKRRAAIKLQASQYVLCQNCKALMMPHAICPNCGYYGNRKVLNKKNEEPSRSAA